MRLIIAGSRTLDIGWHGVDCAIRLLSVPDITEVVCGMARGIDLAGKEWARRLEWEDYPLQSSAPIVSEFPADWDKHGRSAGHIRNGEMAKYADALLLIWDGQSRGSANMKAQMEKLGKPVYEVILKKPQVKESEPDL
jgi:hypothetical protein